LGEEYRSFNSSICSCLHSLVISFILGTNNKGRDYKPLLQRLAERIEGSHEAPKLGCWSWGRTWSGFTQFRPTRTSNTRF
jgi:hypothetical protein